MDDNSIMPFGKHKGIPLKDVPDDYLYWLHGAGTSNNELAEYLEDNIDSIKQNINKNRHYNKV